MIEKKELTWKAPGFAALALAFASFGDAFLYPFLPVNYQTVGVPLMWVGVLLSINRFVRILSNTMIVHAFAKYGLRAIMITAVVLAITSTLGYAMATGVVVWLLFRIIWGLAFSAMRIGTLGYALQHERQGFALGFSRSLQETGPMLSLFLAPLLLLYFDSGIIFYVLAVLSLPALYFAWRLPIRHDKTQSLQGKWFLQWPSTLNSTTLISAMVIDGIVVVVLGVLFLHYHEQISLATATTLAAFYLGYRRVCLVVLSPAGGWIADKIGTERVFNISLLFIIAGLMVMVSGWIGAGAVTVFTFYSINSAITPGSASKTNGHSLAAVAENATWRDVGAALGTLLGGFLISSSYLNYVLQGGTLLMTILLLIHWRNAQPILKQIFSWK
jgi:MFS transporter, DHA1 family, multidrug resistance protein